MPAVILFSLLTHDCYLEFCCDFSEILANRDKLKIKPKVFSTKITGRCKHVTSTPINLTFRWTTTTVIMILLEVWDNLVINPTVHLS